MKRTLSFDEVVYDINLNNSDTVQKKDDSPEYCDIYKKLKLAFSIQKEGYNIYIADTYSKYKTENIINYVKEILKDRESPKDICYVIYEDAKYPAPLLLKNSSGKKLKNIIESIKDNYYNSIVNFYTSSENKEKESILDDIYKKRSHHMGVLLELAKNEGFDLKSTNQGLAFIPLKSGIAMTEKEYDTLENKDRDDILEKAAKLKNHTEGILEELKELEISSINKIKGILKLYLKKVESKNRARFRRYLINDEKSMEYFKYINKKIQEELVENYSMNFEDDEEKISEIINRFQVNVIVDNSNNSTPQVIFEADAAIGNLAGNIEYENHNGVYSTDVSLITSGDILKANEGCLIIRMSSLINNIGSYYYLKKVLLNQKAYYDFNKGYLEIFSLNGLSPLPIDIDLKVILIGDTESYDLLYSYDEDFKSLFPIRAEFNPIVDITPGVVSSVVSCISDTIKNNGLCNISEEAVKEVFRYLSRRASNKKKLCMEKLEIEKVLFLAHNHAADKGTEITKKCITEVIYGQELIQEEIMKTYSSKKILIQVQGETVGTVNALSVIDLGYVRFGKPMRITSICTKGNGRVIDVHKENNLSGNIHGKSVAIIQGALSKFFPPYEPIPVDFHLSFEQTYGMLEGDSASVAELISIISSLGKIPVKQNIAVTGSINQFGEIQPIGGVNEKIEGFFNVCTMDNDTPKAGVLIPAMNIDEVVLNPQVEQAVKEGVFKIYTMSVLTDALEILLLKEEETIETLMLTLKNEIDKYKVQKNIIKNL